MSRDRLLIRIWGYDFEGNDRVVDNHIKKLRRALGSAASQIKTLFKKGYKLGVE
ncbi:MAG: winged helix-turn-helix domain-containing protein [Natronincolaceae bacterium]